MQREETTKLRRSQRDYNLAFKLEVIGQVESGELSYKQAQRKYGIQGRSTVLTWLRKLGTLDWTRPTHHPMKSKEPTPDQRIKELETLLKQERDRNLIYKTMVDIIEKEYGISVGKSLYPSNPKTQTGKASKIATGMSIVWDKQTKHLSRRKAFISTISRIRKS